MAGMTVKKDCAHVLKETAERHPTLARPANKTTPKLPKNAKRDWVYIMPIVENNPKNQQQGHDLNVLLLLTETQTAQTNIREETQ